MLNARSCQRNLVLLGLGFASAVAVSTPGERLELRDGATVTSRSGIALTLREWHKELAKGGVDRIVTVTAKKEGRELTFEQREVAHWEVAAFGELFDAKDLGTSLLLVGMGPVPSKELTTDELRDLATRRFKERGIAMVGSAVTRSIGAAIVHNLGTSDPSGFVLSLYTGRVLDELHPRH